MKKITRLSVLFMLFSATFVSCDTEPVDPVLSENIGEENPGTDPGTDPATSSGDYFPLAVNNQWIFLKDGAPIEPIKIIATQTINDKQYYKVNQYFEDAGTAEMTGTAVIYFRKDGGSYIQRVTVDVPDQEGMHMTVSPYEYIMLKDNLDVGQTWTQTVTQVTTYEVPSNFPIDMPDITTILTIDGKILEKDVTAIVNGHTYENVIKISLKQTAVIEGMGTGLPPTVINSELWFAKNVGPIKSSASAPGMGVIVQDSDSYIVN
ncbi:hypothetical protein R1T16_16540 [Flavobacterium sp. DG1-102-2]|uniref:hypothetical protein n=1 Tax=Flavobacterium sp. DG1-102-2 TaxID=3081663 RepID=UPI002949F06A|nr:hypothetical protein [Flavobacterium sp. DG1-102-2]MDV6170048.1 hypothetical protein [Flavobacterium sp. DG1-102-2]